MADSPSDESSPSSSVQMLSSWGEDEAANAVQDVKAMCETLIEVAHLEGRHPVAVFDIDETLLLNHTKDEDLVARNPPVAALHDFLDERGVGIYVVTARRWTDWSHAFATKQLKFLEYPTPQQLFMVNREHDEDPSASIYKLEARSRVAEGLTNGKPHSIILNVGDQASDHLLLGVEDNALAARNAAFARAHLDPRSYHAMARADGVSKVSLKLPERYVVD